MPPETFVTSVSSGPRDAASEMSPDLRSQLKTSTDSTGRATPLMIEVDRQGGTVCKTESGL